MKDIEAIIEALQELEFKSVLEINAGVGDLTKAILENFTLEKYNSCDPVVDNCLKLQERLFGTYMYLINSPCYFKNLVVGDKSRDLVITRNAIEQAENKEEVLLKMMEAAAKYVVYTCSVNDDPAKLWDQYKEEWNATGHFLTQTRILVIAKRIQ